MLHYVGNGVVAGKITEAETRGEALARCAATYGSERAGVRALDVDCTFCEDRPTPNAARWTDPAAPKHAPCPRCGRTHQEG
jgi:hypothetical protein